MQKIMLNDRYGLTQAVIEGRKSVTRRIEGGALFQEMADNADQIFYNEDDGTLDMRYEGIDIFSHKCRYKVGEVVAVAQSYKALGYSDYALDRDPKDVLHVRGTLGRSSGWNNKMFVRADACKTHIRITGIRCERLQEISDEDCLREGIFVNEYNGGKCHHYGFDGFFNGREGWFAKGWYDRPQGAFASLIDKVSGRGTWTRNLWVVVYGFEPVK